MSEKLPKMPEPAAWCWEQYGLMNEFCSEHEWFWCYDSTKPDESDRAVFRDEVPLYTASQVLSLQRDTWMRAMEVAANAAESAEAGDGSHDYNAGAETMRDRCAAAIRALPMPEGGE
jgi:hypothetical protein